jgi:hypothetical protein
MLTRVDPTLDRPVILFKDIVEILHRSMPAILLQSLPGRNSFRIYPLTEYRRFGLTTPIICTGSLNERKRLWAMRE